MNDYNECYACGDKVDVFLDEAHNYADDYCFKCFCSQSTWDESEDRYYTKIGYLRIITLRLRVHEITTHNRKIIEWEERCEKLGIEFRLPLNVVREELHRNPNWFPELHEVCHLLPPEVWE